MPGADHPTVGVIAIARPTFDLETARPITAAAFRALGRATASVSGSPEPAMDVAAVDAASRLLGEVDVLVVLQATFTDGTLHRAAVAAHPDTPVVLWAFPEPRTGARLKLNSLCGINLGAFTLADRELRWLYVEPGPEVDSQLDRAIREPMAQRHPTPMPPSAAPDVSDLVAALARYRIGIIGDHPDGFEPCGFEDAELRSVRNPQIDRVELEDLFGAASTPNVNQVDKVRASVAENLRGLDAVDGIQATLRLHLGLRSLSAQRGWDAVATRCWPECFTEFGGAACAGQAMLDEFGIPATCERDVFGALTALVLRDAAKSSPFVADLVDVDFGDDTAAIWHCGIAPLSLAHPDDTPEAALHPNRNLPLLHQFRLRPGLITIARFNRARSGVRLTVGRGEILDRPRPFSGTSAVVRPSSGTRVLVDTIMSERLEHHYGIVHGDVGDSLIALARELDLDLVYL